MLSSVSRSRSLSWAIILVRRTRVLRERYANKTTPTKLTGGYYGQRLVDKVFAFERDYHWTLWESFAW
jgi:hypothetical protein